VVTSSNVPLVFVPCEGFALGARLCGNILAPLSGRIESFSLDI
jgi:hypothetical protein